MLIISSFVSFLCSKGKQFQADINRDNPLGFGGSLAVSFAVILRQLWSGQRDSIEPSTLKSLLANRASQFSGYAQHDAQEFMAFLLDGLHEVIKKQVIFLATKETIIILLFLVAGFESCSEQAADFSRGIGRTAGSHCGSRGLERLQEAKRFGHC
jgi:hypothetical protein